ncbi:MAG: SGNH/GDSL hydrolase family protein, partial [Kofleriaceae bacterium]
FGVPDALAGPPDAPDGAVEPPVGHLLYPTDRRHSPISAAVVARLAAIAATAPQSLDMFAKLGDSITASTSFVSCFDGGSVQLGTHGELAQTIVQFLAGNAAGTSPFARTSLAAVGGTTTHDAITGSPCSVERELAAISPRFSIVMFGTNDVRYGRSLDAFGGDLWTIFDLAIARGSIPIASTIPPMGDPGSDARIPMFNLVVRALAQGLGIPLVDYHRELTPLPGRGLSADQLHPSAAPGGACLLTTTGLAYGFNVRNLITLEALARARAALAGTPADASAPVRAGTGRAAAPFAATLPLADLGDTRVGEALRASYPGCSGARTGHEVVYRFDLAAQTTIDAAVVDRGSVDVDLVVVTGSLDGPCVAAGDRTVTATVGPGPVYLVADARSQAADGEFVVVAAARP